MKKIPSDPRNLTEKKSLAAGKKTSAPKRESDGGGGEKVCAAQSDFEGGRVYTWGFRTEREVSNEKGSKRVHDWNLKGRRGGNFH